MTADGTARPRSILVTGSGSGIGAAICRALAAPGTGFVVHARGNAEGAARVAEAVVARGGEAVVALGDLTEPGTAARLVGTARARFGGLDVLVSNAGFADRTPFAELTPEGYARSVATIQTAFFDLARAAIPLLKQGRDPRIVAIGSFVSHAFRPELTLFPASAAAKAAVEAMVKALAIELAPERVTVNCVAPGFTRKDADRHTAMDPARFAAMARTIPLGRLGEPEDVAAAVAYLASPAAGYVTGQVLHVNGGVHIGG